MELREGLVISGQFLVGRIMAEDDSGVLLEARQATPDRAVTIKVLAAGTPQDRLVAQYAKATEIASEHVPALLDVGSLEDGRPFVVMEHLEGQTLSDLLAQGPLSVESAVDCIIQACEAVAAAHSLGVVHRRLRSPILFVQSKPDGRVTIKVLDFGTRPATDPRNIPPGTDNDAPDTPEYMAPEQLVAPKHAGRRCDQWALGIILFELLTGQLPFTGKTRDQLIRRIVEKPMPSLRSLRKDVPEQLEVVVARSLQKARGSRYANIHEFALALAPFASHAMRNLAARIVLGEPPGRTVAPSEPPRPASAPPPARLSSAPSAPASPLLTSSEGIAFRKVLRDGRIETLDAEAAARATRAKRVEAEALLLARDAASRPPPLSEDDGGAAPAPIISLRVPVMSTDPVESSLPQRNAARTLLLLMAILASAILLGVLAGITFFLVKRH